MPVITPSNQTFLCVLAFLSQFFVVEGFLNAPATNLLRNSYGTETNFCSNRRVCVSSLHMKKAADVESYKVTAAPGGSVIPAPVGAECLRLNPKLLPRGELPSRLKIPNSQGVNLQYPGMRVLHVDPLVLTIDKFCTPEECDALLGLHKARDPAPSLTFGGAFTAAERTSTTWHLYYSEVQALLAKGSAVLQCDATNFEEPQIVRYENGQLFSWHYDSVPPDCLDNGGQRVATLLVYLNDVDPSAGGATQFRDLGQLKVQPTRGRALIFFPADRQTGEIDERTIHAGQPCLGVKWVAQLWLHQGRYTPRVPPGNAHIEPLAVPSPAAAATRPAAAASAVAR